MIKIITKIIEVESSAGVIIPEEILKQNNIKIGDELLIKILAKK